MDPNPQPAGGRRDGIVLAAAALLLYGLLGQRVFYKTDGVDLVWLLHEGERHHPWHVGYLPVLAAFRGLVEWTGCSLLRTGALLSACGAAVGVWGTHRAALLMGLGRGAAALAAGLLALNPGTLLFATVVEFHGPLLGAVGLCLWWTARQARAPGWAGMAVLGVLTHGAFLMHGSALFLPALLLPWFLARRWSAGGDRRRDLLLAALAGAVHGALFLLLPRIWPAFYGDYADLSAAMARETSTGRPQGIEWTPTILVQEWLLPLLPLSVAWLPALGRRPLRGEAAALVLGLLPLLYVCVRQLVFEPERGAYLLPLLPVAALLTVRCWGPRLLAALVLLSAGIGVAQVLHHEATTARAGDAWLADLRAAAGPARPFALLDTHRELRWAMAALAPGVFPAVPGDFLYVRRLSTMPRAALGDAHLDGMAAWLQARLGEGRAVLLSTDTLRALADPAGQARAEKATVAVPPTAELAGPSYLQRLREQFELAPAGDRFVRLLARP